VSKKKYPLQQVNLEGLHHGLIVNYQGENYKISGELWHQVFNGILEAITINRLEAHKTEEHIKFVLSEYEKQFETIE
jgi:hypothetical protein